MSRAKQILLDNLTSKLNTAKHRLSCCVQPHKKAYWTQRVGELEAQIAAQLGTAIPAEVPKLTGGLVSYYLASVAYPQREDQLPYVAECEDIIQALGMTFDEGCAFKALWRTAAARLGNGKPGQKEFYDAEKLVHYSGRILKKAKRQEK